VGCVLLNPRGHVLATGYNGVAVGLPHCNEAMELVVRGKAELIYPHACPGAGALSGTNLDSCEAVHAEQNALLQCRDVYDIETCVVTVGPCMTCTKLLLNTGCQRILLMEEYSQPVARELWQRAGRLWQKFSTVVNEKEDSK